MQGVQKRPLTGMLSAGVAAPRAINNVAPTTVHTLDNSTEQNGGPFIDMVELWVSNGSGGALTVSVIVAGGATVALDIADNTVIKIFDDAVFHNAPGVAAATITAQASAGGLFFWGTFARPL